MTFEEILRARLATLIERHGFSLTKLGVELGGSHTWLLRKLDLERLRFNALKASDVDTVLQFLGEPPEVLFSPVLLPGDMDMLRYVSATGRPSIADAATLIAHAEPAALRLYRQGLIAFDEAPNFPRVSMSLTDLGSKTLAAPTAA